MWVEGRTYTEVQPGETFRSGLTVTEAHLAQGAGLIGDFNPLHVDEAFARRSRYGSRILHGMITSAFMGSAVGMYFAGTAIAYLEHGARFTAPVRPGDTLDIRWTVREKLDKPAHGGGVVVLDGVCRNQDGVVVAEARAKILVAAQRPAPA